MRPRTTSDVGAGTASFLLAVPMLGLLVLPVLALILATTPADLAAGLRHPLFASALWLSARTTVIALVVVLAAGTPLAWWLAAARAGPTRVVEVLMRLPIVIPPAVVGIGLLATFGRTGLFGPLLQALGLQVPFSAAAVVLAQVVVAAPFYVQSAASAFRRVDADLLIVARTLGQRPAGAFLRVALPLAMPGLIGGASLAWARALGEFGATLLFAGNLPGVTQTMPLAIYTALESDVRVARALSLVLAVLGLALLLALRLLPELWTRRRAVRAAAIASAPSRQGRQPGRPEPAPRHAADWQVRLSAHLGSFELDVDLRGGAVPVALIGPNGAGKTTLLRLIAGVHRPDAGLIRVGDEVLYDSERALSSSPEERRVAYVPQGFGLFPHLSVSRQRRLRPARRAPSPAPCTDRLRAAGELLARHGRRTPPGTAARRASPAANGSAIALMRALLVDPLLLLLDEPLSSLDAQARQTLRTHLADHLAERARPAIIVSHDARDVLALHADVYAIEGGRIVQHGPAERIAADPATAFLAEFFAGGAKAPSRRGTAGA